MADTVREASGPSPGSAPQVHTQGNEGPEPRRVADGPGWAGADPGLGPCSGTCPARRTPARSEAALPPWPHAGAGTPALGTVLLWVSDLTFAPPPADGPRTELHWARVPPL